MKAEELAVVHAVELVPRKDENIAEVHPQEVAAVLPDGVGIALVP